MASDSAQIPGAQIPGAQIAGAQIAEAPIAGARIAVVGIHGHGASHVLNAGRIGRLAAVVDPRPPEPGSPATTPDVRWFADLDGLLGSGLTLDAVVLCTPLHTHAAMT